MKGDVSVLAGKVFAATSGNTCEIHVVGDQAVCDVWIDRPSLEDIREFISWVERRAAADSV